MSLTPDNQRVFRASKKSDAAVVVSDDTAILAASKDNFVLANKQGVTIKGPISMITPSHEIRVGGMWTLTSDFMRMLPSTIVTPLPNQILMPPTGGIPEIKEAVVYMLGALAI